MEIKPCDPKIFKEGKTIAALDAKSEAAEKWVQAVAKRANAKVDWHYSGGIANVLYLGNNEVRARVEKSINDLEKSLDGQILRIFEEEDSGLYRKGVTEVPKGASAGFYLPGDKGSTFI